MTRRRVRLARDRPGRAVPGAARRARRRPRFAAAAVAAGAVGVLAARPVDAPAVIVPPAPRAAGTGLDATDPDGSGAAVLAALARLAAHVVGRALPGAHRRRRHRQLRQDLDQGPAGRRARARWARRWPRPARSTTSWACPGPRCGPTATPGTWCWSSPRAGPATSPRWPGPRRRGSASCSTSARAHLGEFGSTAAIAAAKGELVEALPRRTGVAVLNADDPAVARDGRPAPPPGCVTVGRAAGRRRAAPTTSRLDAGRARFRLVTPGRRGRRSRCGWSARTTSATRWPRPRWRWSSGGTPDGVAAALGAATPASRWRMEVTDRPDGVTVINDAYNANPDSMRAALRRAGRASAAGAAHLGGARAGWPSWAPRPRPRTPGSPRAARRLGVDELVAVGRPGLRRAARRVGRRRRGRSRCCAPSCGPATSCWSRRPGRPAWNGSPPALLAASVATAGSTVRSTVRARLRRRRRRAGHLHPAHAVPDPVLLPAGLRPGDPRRGPAEPPGQARHPDDGRGRDPARASGSATWSRTWSPASRSPRRRCWCCS